MNVRICLTGVGVVTGLVACRALAVERWVPSPNYPTIQSAIDACSAGDEVIIEPNTYTGDGNRDLDFGGRAITVRSTDPDDPNVVAATVIDCGGTEADRHRGFHFYSGEGADSVVAGVTITNACAPMAEAADNRGSVGGGIFCTGSSPTIIHCTIAGNTAIAEENDWEDAGGPGIACIEGSSPTIAHCRISDNSAFAYRIAGGGGIYCNASDPNIIDCVITGNIIQISGTLAAYGGGIMCDDLSSPTISRCTISANASIGGPSLGGGISCYNDGSPTIDNCMITSNSSEEFGGGIGVQEGGDPTITHCTVTRNTAGAGGGVVHAIGGTLSLVSCIVWGNTGGEIVPVGANPTATYCDVQGGWPGDGNIDVDPLFVDPNGPDGDPNTWDDNDFHLSPNSPCINTGDPNGVDTGQIDIDGQPRVIGGRVDMGADEKAFGGWRRLPNGEWHYCGAGMGAAMLSTLLGMLGLMGVVRRNA